MKSAFLPQIKSHADAVLHACGIPCNPYFVALEEGGLTLAAFRASQEQFYFAVAFFSRPMAGLVARLPDYASRATILGNIVEEHGGFCPADAHAMTFRKFLESLGSDVASLDRMRPAAFVHAFNSVLFSACLLEEIEVGIGCVGMIEYAFAGLSARTGRDVVARGWVTQEKLVHYTLHAELDQIHAEEFFGLLIPGWEDPLKRESIERGMALGAYIFDRLYRDMAG